MIRMVIIKYLLKSLLFFLILSLNTTVVKVLYILRYDMQAVLLKITVCQMKVFLNKAESILINYARLINYAYAYLFYLPRAFKLKIS